MPAPRGDKWETDIEARLARLEQLKPFANSGLHVTAPGVLDSDNFEAGVSGFRLAETPEFNDLLLRGGIIGNDALTDPVKPQVVKLVATGFSLTTSLDEKDGTDLIVPAGFTRLAVNMFGRMYSLNPNSTGGADTFGTDALYVRVLIGASASTATPTGISGNGGFATTNTFDAYNLTGLTPGGTLRFAVQGRSAYQPIAADASNYISAVAQLTWLR